MTPARSLKGGTGGKGGEGRGQGDKGTRGQGAGSTKQDARHERGGHEVFGLLWGDNLVGEVGMYSAKVLFVECYMECLERLFRAIHLQKVDSAFCL